MPVLELRTHLPTREAVEAVENVVEALDTVLWLAQDIGGGEHECGPAHVERQINTLIDALGVALVLAAEPVGRELRKAPLECADIEDVRTALLARMAVNAAAKLTEAAA